MGHASGVGCENPLPNPCSPAFSPVTASGSATVLTFTFRSLIHSELAFLKGQFCVCVCPVVLTPFVVQIILSLLDFPSCFFKDLPQPYLLSLKPAHRCPASPPTCRHLLSELLQ